MTGAMTEDRLVQKTTADYFQVELGWDSVYAYNEETYGPDSMLGRNAQTEVVLVRHLKHALKRYNPELPDAAYESAVKTIIATSISKSTLQINREKYKLFKSGVPVKFKNDQGHIEERRLKVFDFGNPLKNHFMVVREMWIKRTPYKRRPDIIGFVNGIPLLFIELKNIHKDIRRAYNENLKDYKDTIPLLFDLNAFIMLSNGDKAKMGSLSAKYGHFNDWKRLAEDDVGVVDFETILKGVCTKSNFMDLFENFILFDESAGTLAKIVARNHQYLGVNRAIQSVKDRDRLRGQLGVFWHTQGSGKSYSMLFFSQKVHRKLTGNFTFLIVTDRDDLETQIYKTFAGCGIVDNDQDQCRASSGGNLRELFSGTKEYVFTMIHKFNQDVGLDDIYSDRSDIIVISDEAHRTQYGRLALNMRNALPNAHYIGFTGTPLFQDDEITKKIFGGYVSTYDFQRAVEDNATVPLFYDSRGEKLKLTTTDINLKLADKLEETELDPDQQILLEKELSRAYHVITASKRLTAIADDFVEHYATRWETGKAMFVSIDKITAVRTYNLVQTSWQKYIDKTEAKLEKTSDQQEEMDLRRKLEWLKETDMAVVVSEEQGEIEKFKKWDLDIVPHRTLMKSGFETADGKTLEIDLAFKKEGHPFRVVFVCAMWLTGFDVPSLSTLYLDKPLKAHTLMQGIARANRINESKNNGLIVDYCGILKNLREALATFAGGGGIGGGPGEPKPPVKPEEELLAELAEAIDHTKEFLKERGFKLNDVTTTTGFDKIAIIKDAKEVINQSEETRKRFEILARIVFKKFKACLTIKAGNDYKEPHDAIDIIYKKLQGDRDTADISSIIQALHDVLDKAIDLKDQQKVEEKVKENLYDISKIDFELLQQEFAKHKRKNTTVYCLKEAIERKLASMLKKNPLRTDFNARYQEIIQEYNHEKNRTTIEKTFAELIKFVDEMNDEEKRSAREGLTEEKLALFDLLLKPEISKADRKKVKLVAAQLLEALKEEKLRIQNWRENESTKAAVKTYILNYLYDDNTGLPDPFYTIDDVEHKAGIVFDHVFLQYQDSRHNVYA